MIEALADAQPFLNMLTAAAAFFAAIFICTLLITAAARESHLTMALAWLSVLLLGGAGVFYYAFMLNLSAYVVFGLGAICLLFSIYSDKNRELDYLFMTATSLLIIGSGVAFYYWYGIVSGMLTTADAILILRPVGVHRDLALMLLAAALHRNSHIFLRLKRMHTLIETLGPEEST